MPRPGPRPYECVRRSWHSDRLQPVRGSIIQQIFRVVHEIHSSGTKKNREWQEKLPLVVFKSEEIMYSKANSEAEYTDPGTLWDRVNDAINTIIRKDESLETGEYLPPCIEAALNLGCVPVRTTRSQRNSNTRSYLGSRNQDPGSVPPKAIDTATSAQNLNSPNHDKANAVNQTHTYSEANRDVRQNYKIAPPGPSYPPSIENFPTQIVPIGSRASLAASSVYPLYYPGTGFHTTHQNSNTIIVGTPVFQTVHEPLPLPPMEFCERSFSLHNNDNSSKKTIYEEPQPSPVECDLSLRLGLGGSTCVDDADLGPSSSISSPRNKEFSFFPLNSEGEQGENLVADVRKRKAAPVNNNVVEGGQYLCQLETDFNQKRHGL